MYFNKKIILRNKIRHMTLKFVARAFPSKILSKYNGLIGASSMHFLNTKHFLLANVSIRIQNRLFVNIATLKFKRSQRKRPPNLVVLKLEIL